MDAMSRIESQLFGEGKAYTFADYFKLPVDIEDVLTHFGYTFQAQNRVLPRTSMTLDRLQELKSRIEESLPYLSLTSETARREFLIAPILMDVIHYTHAKIKVEYPVEVNDQLKGTLDYYVQAKRNLLIIEAKYADLQKGFTQLAVELVALDQWTESDASVLYGAVSIGNIWQFGLLNRQAKQVIQDLNLYRVPADVEDLLRVLVGILSEEL
jgi:hypothetical protein